MTFKIGFTASEEKAEELAALASVPAAPEERPPRRSVVRVHFPQRNMTLAYYNDRFDLRYGDIVYVDGKLEGKLGRVEEINYNFRIDLADYKRVIAVVDTTVSGRFYLAGSHFLTFDRSALPREKVVSWFKAPPKPDVEYVSGSDESSFSLDNLNGIRIDPAAAGRGCSYYAENRVRYLCLDGTKGYALVEGTKPYDVEFEFSDGMIYALTCSCYCAGACKHEYAAMRQMQELFDRIKKNYGEEYIQNRYFAAVTREILFSCALHGRNTGTLMLDPPAPDAPDFDEESDGDDETWDDSDW